MEIITSSDTDTLAAGTQFAHTLRGGEVVYLYGDLGSGKTTFVKGVAAGLGITADITSPTFTIMNVYPIPSTPPIHTLVHVDTYRLTNPKELIDIGIEDYVGKPHSTLLVEWPDKVETLFDNKKIVRVVLEHLDGNTRRITIE